ncbi:MAG: hypothetical protein M1832_002332 [Thelocarpon impressellum]|nr:MAG: hypothetical protein M1832_002332 [Thelocarpon impressellum]
MAHVSPAKRDRDLMSWWKRFQSREKKGEEKKGKDPPTDPDHCESDAAAAAAAVNPRPRLSSLFHEMPSTPSLRSRASDARRSGEVVPGSRRSLIEAVRRSETLPRVGGFWGSGIMRSPSFGADRRHVPSSPRPSTPPGQESPPSLRSRVRAILHLRDFAHPFRRAVEPPTGIFAVPLSESIKYANVAISLTDGDGKSFIYGYVPIVVAKCGVFLKEKATDVEGIFRLSGSAKRIKDLQTLFDSPDRYGKGLDWTGYTVHDAANILRRYLNQLPEPVVPLDFYERFRDPLRNHEMQAVGDLEAQAHDIGGFDEEATIKVYQQMITELPPLSRQLLLYILDLLAVFASKSDLNRMSSTNLAAIFQPGMLSHPSHDMSPGEYRLSQDVLVFLIEKQDHFLIGMRGTAADDETVKEVQSGGTPQATTPTSAWHGRPGHHVGRSSSGASAGADSIRRFGGVRRNMSVSSKQSKHSSTTPSPINPAPVSPGASSVHRSNTVPSKKSPALQSGRLGGKPSEPPTPTSAGLGHRGPSVPSPIAHSFSPGPRSEETAETPGAASAEGGVSATTPADAPPPDVATAEPPPPGTALGEPGPAHDSAMLEAPSPAFRNQSQSNRSSSSLPPAKERGFSTFFSRSPTSDTERKDGKAPNKLKKKRAPGSGNQSAHSSTGSLHEP